MNRIPAKNGDRYCQSLTPASKDRYITDSQVKGLRLRIKPSGHRSWVLGYKVKVAATPTNRPGDNYVHRTMGLGSFSPLASAVSDALNVYQARKKAQTIKTEIQAGKDPVQEKRLAQAARLAQIQTQITVNDLFNDWLRHEVSNRKDGGAEVTRIMKKDVLSAIGGLEINQVQKQHIREITSQVLQRGERIANVVFSLIRQMFSWSVEQDYLERDPTMGIKKSRIGHGGKSRKRVLEDCEIKELFNRLLDAGLPYANSLAIPIQLGTMCRIGELLSARWEHVCFEKRIWLLPTSKNNESHVIHLSDFVVRHFQLLHEQTGEFEFCYPNQALNGHMNEKNISKQIRDRQRTSDDIIKGRTQRHADSLLLRSHLGERWTSHGLRRTGSTIMGGKLGILPAVIDRCQNHLEANPIRRTYQRQSYWLEMVEAWDLLGDRLDELYIESL